MGGAGAVDPKALLRIVHGYRVVFIRLCFERLLLDVGIGRCRLAQAVLDGLMELFGGFRVGQPVGRVRGCVGSFRRAFVFGCVGVGVIGGGVDRWPFVSSDRSTSPRWGPAADPSPRSFPVVEHRRAVAWAPGLVWIADLGGEDRGSFPSGCSPGIIPAVVPTLV